MHLGGFHFIIITSDLTITVPTKENIVASLLKFAEYIHHYKILLWNIFGCVLKNKTTITGIFDFLPGLLEQKVL